MLSLVSLLNDALERMHKQRGMKSSSTIDQSTQQFCRHLLTLMSLINQLPLILLQKRDFSKILINPCI